MYKNNYSNDYRRSFTQNSPRYVSSQPMKKKRSGAKFKMAKNGKMVVVAWKATKMGMLSILVGTTKYTKAVTSQNGRTWLTGCSVSIKNGLSGVSSFHFGMMDKATGKTIVKDLGWVINPQGGLGGVVAQIGKKS